MAVPSIRKTGAFLSEAREAFREVIDNMNTSVSETLAEIGEYGLLGGYAEFIHSSDPNAWYNRAGVTFAETVDQMAQGIKATVIGGHAFGEKAVTSTGTKGNVLAEGWVRMLAVASYAFGKSPSEGLPAIRDNLKRALTTKGEERALAIAQAGGYLAQVIGPLAGGVALSRAIHPSRFAFSGRFQIQHGRFSLSKNQRPTGWIGIGVAACATAPDEKKQNLSRKADQYHIEGNSHFDRGNWSKALESYGKSLAISQETDDRYMTAMTHMNMGHVYQSKSQWTKALDHYRKSLAIKEKLGNHNGMADTYNSIGIVHHLAGKLSEAMDAFTESLAISQAKGDYHGIVRAYINIGSVYQRKGDLSKALEFYEKSLRIAERSVGDRLWVADICDNIATVHYLEESFGEALWFFEKSLNIRREFDDYYGMAKVLGDIGTLYRFQNNWPKAFEFYNRGLQIIMKLDNPRRTAKAYHNMGEVHLVYGDSDQGSLVIAEEFFNRSLAINQEIDNQYGMAEDLYWRGLVAIKMGKNSEARQDLSRALEIASEVGASEIADDAQKVLKHLGAR